MAATWEFRRDLFDVSTVSRIASHYGSLLRAITESPDRPIRVHSLMQDREKQQLLVEWNKTDTHVEPECIHHLIEAQSCRNPDAIALIADNLRLSFHELNARADQLARHLQNLGTVSEIAVPVLLDRSPAMVVAWLGILKAGCAYVPLGRSQE